MPHTWHDYICHATQRQGTELARQGKYITSRINTIGGEVLNKMQQEVKEIPKVYSRALDEPNCKVIEEYASLYVNREVVPMLQSMFVGKTVDFVENLQVDGIINVQTFNCMYGKVSTICTQPLKKKHEHLPMLTYIDDGLKQTNIRTRIEAFMHQAVAYKKLKQNTQYNGLIEVGNAE